MIKQKHKEVVLGNSLSAVLFAYLNDFPIIINSYSPPPFFETLDPEIDMSSLFIEPDIKWCQKIDSRFKVGNAKQQVWEHLLFVLSLAGLATFRDNVQSVRLVDENHLKVISLKNVMVEMEFEHLHIFDTTNVNGLPPPRQEENKRRVLDWIKITYDWNPLEYHKTNNELVNELIFYPSTRSLGNHKEKDLIVSSILTQEQLRDPDFSDTCVKFEALHILKELGFRGRRNGRKPHNPAEYAYYSLALEVTERQALPEKMAIYEDTATISFNYRSEYEIMERNKKINLLSNTAKFNKVLDSGKRTSVTS